MANDECGTDTTGPTTLTCAGGTYANGIMYGGTDSLYLDLSAGPANMPANGVWITNNAPAAQELTIRYNNSGTINTTIRDSGGVNNGLFIIPSGSAAATIILDQGTIQSNAALSTATRIYSNSTGNSTIRINGGTVNLTGNTSFGAEIQQNSSSSPSDSLIDMTGGNITALGTVSGGLRIFTFSRLGNSTIYIHTGTNVSSIVNTCSVLCSSGFGADIIVRAADGQPLAQVIMDSPNTTISLAGSQSYGLHVKNGGNYQSLTRLANGSIIMSGVNSQAVFSENNGSEQSSSLTQMSGGSITLGGNTDYGLRSSMTGYGSAKSEMTGGRITGTGLSTIAIDATITQGSNRFEAKTTMSAGTIILSGASSFGMNSNTSGTAESSALTVMSGGSIETRGASSYGLYARSSGFGKAVSQMTGGSIQSSSGNGSIGILARTTSLANATEVRSSMSGGLVTMMVANSFGVSSIANGNTSSSALSEFSGGTIDIQGANSFALRAQNTGYGSATSTMSNGQIKASGQSVKAIESNITYFGTAGMVTSTLTGGSITMTGSRSTALRAATPGTGQSLASMSGGTVTVTGDTSQGVSAILSNPSSPSTATSTIEYSGGTLTMTGANSDGIYAENTGLGKSVVNFTGGTLVSGSGLSTGIHTVSQGGSIINIGPDAVLDSSASGVAIRDGDRMTDADGNGKADEDNNGDGFLDAAPTVAVDVFQRDGIDEARFGSNATVNSEGTVTGDAVLGLGNDTFNLKGGTYGGFIYGDDKGVAASDDGLVNWEGNDTFNWTGGTLTGGFYGQDGNDTATVSAAAYDGSQVLDGGNGTDSLTMTGINATTTGAKFRNWETINLTNSTFSISDFTFGTFDTCNNTLTFSGNSRIGSVRGCSAADNITLSGSTIVSGSVEAAGGGDRVSVLDDASVEGGIYGAGNGQDGSAASDGADTIIINTTGRVKLIDTGDGADTVTVFNGTIKETIDTGAGDDTFTWSGGSVGGDVNLGDGNDTATVSAAAYDGSQMLDGGDGTDSLTVQNRTAMLRGDRLKNWETLIYSGSTVEVSGTPLTTGSGAGQGLFLRNGTIMNAGTGFTLNGNLDLASGTRFAMPGAGSGRQVVSGNLVNNGLIDMQDSFAGDRMTAQDYSGSGQINMDVDMLASLADRFFILGNATGSTQLHLNLLNANASTGQTIRLVDVSGTSASNAFYLTDIVTAGTYRYALVQNGANWDLAPAAPDPVTPDPPTDPVTPKPPKDPVTPDPPTDPVTPKPPKDPVTPDPPTDPVTQKPPKDPVTPKPSPLPGTAAIFEAYLANLDAFGDAGTLTDRVASRFWDNGGNDLPDQGDGEDGIGAPGTRLIDRQPALATTLDTRSTRFSGALSTSGASGVTRLRAVRTGFDGPLAETGNGLFLAGVSGFAATAQSEISGATDRGSIATTGRGLGLSLGWLGENGFFAGAEVSHGWFESDIVSEKEGLLVRQNPGSSLSVRGEISQRISLANGVTLLPQIGLACSRFDFAPVTLADGTPVRPGQTESLKARLGLEILKQSADLAENGTITRQSLTAGASLSHDFRSPLTTLVSGTPLSATDDSFVAGLHLGDTLSLEDDRFQIQSSVSLSSPLADFGHSFSARAQVGLQLHF